MLTLDTSGVLAALNKADPNHNRAVITLGEEDGPFIVPAGIIAEVTYMIESRLGHRVLDVFLSDLEVEAFRLDCGDFDLPRIRVLIGRYADMPLGYADASVVACAERLGARVLTYDIRHFAPIGRAGIIEVAGFSTGS